MRAHLLFALTGKSSGFSRLSVRTRAVSPYFFSTVLLKSTISFYGEPSRSSPEETGVAESESGQDSPCCSCAVLTEFEMPTERLGLASHNTRIPLNRIAGANATESRVRSGMAAAK